MSTAHRPTYVPAQGKQTVGNSRQYSSRDMAGHTKLKFRQPGQGTTSEVARKDLRAELARAETKGPATDDGDEQASKRRRILEEAKDLDKDDEEPGSAPKAAIENGDAAAAAAAESSDDDDDDSDEDETAELLRELEKIKRERAEEKDRQDREASTATAMDREAEVAMGNPLLNLQAALDGRSGSMTPMSSSSSSGFAVKRRWDDDVIFKNQAVSEKPRKEFVNDLLRTEFHKRFLKRFIA